jgi:hypothetical protein
MLGVRDDDHPIVKQGIDIDPVRIELHPHHPHLYAAVKEQFDDLLRVRDDEADADTGGLFLKTSHDPRQKILTGDGAPPNRYPPLDEMGELGEGIVRLVTELQDLFGITVEDPPPVGERNPPAQAVKELEPHALLEGGDVSAHGGLGEIDSLTCSGETFQLSHLTEGLKVFHVHGLVDLGLPQNLYVVNMISASPGKFKEKLTRMSKIILGIHGLGNKPPKRLLERWWEDALKEGLRGIGRPRRFVRFRLVYWAHCLHPHPLDPKVRDKKNPLYVVNPYIPARSGHKKRRTTLRKKVLDYIRRQLRKIMINDDLSLNYTAVTDLIIRRYFRDLDIYYSKRCHDRNKYLRPAKEVIREELARMLRKYKRRDILLIGHSMGSIIAYDVLTQSVPDVRIHTLVTMGSPLGLPPIMIKILAEQGKKPRRHTTSPTPENITTAWYNFSDLRDRVATDYALSDDYAANTRHVRSVDTIIYNDYECQGTPNPHNVYGYLRTPELAHVIDGFLNAEKPKPLMQLQDTINRLLDTARRKKRGQA